MAPTETLIIRAALAGAVYRDVEIEASKSLHKLAEAILSAYGFDFDHAFGFYGGDPFARPRAEPRYELFADMGEADADVRGEEDASRRGVPDHRPFAGIPVRLR